MTKNIGLKFYITNRRQCLITILCAVPIFAFLAVNCQAATQTDASSTATMKTQSTDMVKKEPQSSVVPKKIGDGTTLQGTGKSVSPIVVVSPVVVQPKEQSQQAKQLATDLAKKSVQDAMQKSLKDAQGKSGVAKQAIQPGKPVAAQQAAPTITPAVTNDTITKFAAQVSTQAFTYDYNNYEQNLKKLSDDFTDTGWKSYKEALTNSNNIEVAKQNKLTATAKIVGEIVINQDKTTGNVEQWQVQVPIKVVYETPKGVDIKQNLTVMLSIVSVDKRIKPSGFGIEQFIAKPNVQKEAQ